MFEPLQRLAAADLGKVKITDVKMRPSASHTQIRVDTDAGISGMGESGVTAPMMKAWLEIISRSSSARIRSPSVTTGIA